MVVDKKIVVLQAIGFLLLGLLFARWYLNAVDFIGFFSQFDVLMHVLLIIGIGMTVVGLKRAKD